MGEKILRARPTTSLPNDALSLSPYLRPTHHILHLCVVCNLSLRVRSNGHLYYSRPRAKFFESHAACELRRCLCAFDIQHWDLGNVTSRYRRHATPVDMGGIHLGESIRRRARMVQNTRTSSSYMITGTFLSHNEDEGCILTICPDALAYHNVSIGCHTPKGPSIAYTSRPVGDTQHVAPSPAQDI